MNLFKKLFSGWSKTEEILSDDEILEDEINDEELFDEEEYENSFELHIVYDSDGRQKITVELDRETSLRNIARLLFKLDHNLIQFDIVSKISEHLSPDELNEVKEEYDKILEKAGNDVLKMRNMISKSGPLVRPDEVFIQKDKE